MGELRRRAKQEEKEELEKSILTSEKIDTCIVLLGVLCVQKDRQYKKDNKFEALWVEEKEKANKARTKDTKIGLWVLILANAALYLDFIKIESNGAFVNAVMSLFN